MKKLVLLAFAALMCFSVDANAQVFLKRLGQAAVNTAKKTVENKVEDVTREVVEGAIEGAVDRVTGTGETGGSEPSQTSSQPSQTSTSPSVTSAPAPAAPTAQVQDVTTVYAKSDFVPGDEIFFEDLVEGEKLGEFPSMWDLDHGNAEISTLNGVMAILLVDDDPVIRPLMKEKNYLPEEFTLEMDFYKGDGRKLPGDKILAGDYSILLENDGDKFGDFRITSDEVAWQLTKATDGEGVSGRASLDGIIRISEWNHLSVSFNKRALKVYVNGQRVMSLPNVKNPTSFSIEGNWFTSGEYAGHYLKNIRMAKGAVPLYDRLSSDGKIVTYGITFETGKADLKPESMVEIMRITSLMKNDASLKFEVQGHCDNSGSDQVNDPLSQKRAENIVAALVKEGIDSSRLTAVGKGSHSPIADNGSDEGRAKNRRVEFVKK